MGALCSLLDAGAESEAAMLAVGGLSALGIESKREQERSVRENTPGGGDAAADRLDVLADVWAAEGRLTAGAA